MFQLIIVSAYNVTDSYLSKQGQGGTSYKLEETLAAAGVLTAGIIRRELAAHY